MSSTANDTPARLTVESKSGRKLYEYQARYGGLWIPMGVYGQIIFESTC